MESAGVDALIRANRTADGKLTLEQFDKLYRLVGGFDEGTGRGGAGRTSPYSDPYALSTRDINETAMRKNAESAYARLDYASAQVVADSSTAVLFSKAVPLKALEPERPYSFWVDSHCRLEILEIAIHPEVDKGVRHTVMMSARDQDGRVKVEKAVLFDSGAYFNVESANGNRSTSVKGGPSWSFPGPALYELTLARSLSGGPNPPLPLKMRMVHRFEESEQLDDESAAHPLIAQPRKRRPPSSPPPPSPTARPTPPAACTSRPAAAEGDAASHVHERVVESTGGAAASSLTARDVRAHHHRRRRLHLSCGCSSGYGGGGAGNGGAG